MPIFSETDYLYDWLSCIIDQRIYFGPFPNQIMANRLFNEKFDIILDLTMPKEEPSYFCLAEYHSFPIVDNSFPVCTVSYCKMISFLKMKFASGKKIYIHCRGGHGRSSMTCVSLVCNIFAYDLRRSIEYVNEAHNKREVLRNKWRKRISPFNYDQFVFLTKVHKNIYLNLYRPNKYYNWMLSAKPVRYVTAWCPTERFYPNLYELCKDPDIFYDDKFCSCFSFFYNLFANEKFKLQLTYLKQIVITDSEFPLFDEIVISAMRMARDMYTFSNFL
jgi:hypothetical protein